MPIQSLPLQNAAYRLHRSARARYLALLGEFDGVTDEIPQDLP